MILGPILDHIFGPKKDKLFCPVFVSRRGMPNAIHGLVLYLQSEGLNISWIYPGTIPFQYLKTVFTIQYSTLSLTGSQFIFLKWDRSIGDLGGKFRQKWIHLFWAFWSLSFKFFFKKTHKNIHNQNLPELAHYIGVTGVTVLQIRGGQQSITANLWPLTAHIYHVMIIVTGGFSKKSFYYFLEILLNDLVFMEFKHFYKTHKTSLFSFYLFIF